MSRMFPDGLLFIWLLVFATNWLQSGVKTAPCGMAGTWTSGNKDRTKERGRKEERKERRFPPAKKISRAKTARAVVVVTASSKKMKV